MTEIAIQTTETRVVLGVKEEKETVEEAVSMIASLLDNPYFSDVKFQCNPEFSKPIRAHKAILSARSPYFSALLNSPMMEARENTIHFPEITRNDLYVLLHHLYTGRLSSLVTAKNAANLLELSTRFHIPAMKSFCAGFLLRQLSHSNACKLISVGLRLCEDSLTIRSFHFLVEYCVKKEDVTPPPHFSLITHDILHVLLRIDDILSPEVMLFEFLLYWGKYRCKKEGLDPSKKENIKAKIELLLPLIRYCTMSRQHLADKVYKSGLLSDEMLVHAHWAILTNFKHIEDSDTNPMYRRRKNVTSFKMHPEQHGPNITVSEDGLVLTKANSSYECVIGDKSFDSGQHYWEMEILFYSQAEDIFIGVADMSFSAHESSAPVRGNMWSFLCSNGNKVNTSRQPYGSPVTRAGQRIGVFIDMDERSIGFFVDGIFKGWAYQNLPDEVVPAVCLYYPSASVKLHFPTRPFRFEVGEDGGSTSTGVGVGGISAPALPDEEEEESESVLSEESFGLFD
eukprot:TRINITY_DN63850_c4_g1_i1.p1 TRINITY_DN63850_c4_g1~~TRINITY_DN63850_c4_g1_i1.p1  ORF type:complete len:511 (-),score=123.58 TRINITY_DN63850_c4_g1_i1:1204-2736(-)